VNLDMGQLCHLLHPTMAMAVHQLLVVHLLFSGLMWDMETTHHPLQQILFAQAEACWRDEVLHIHQQDAGHELGSLPGHMWRGLLDHYQD